MAERWWRETWMEAVYAERELKPLEVFVASIYADHAHDGRSSWVTLARLIERSHLSRDAANRALKGLREKGWLMVMQQSKQHRATVYGLVIPESSSTGGVLISSTGDVPLGQPSSTSPDTSSTGGDASSTGGVPNQSLINLHHQSLSRDQELVRSLLRLAEDDERLMKVPSMLEFHNVRAPRVWIEGCHKKGDLLARLEEAPDSPTWGVARSDRSTFDAEHGPPCPKCDKRGDGHFRTCPDYQLILCAGDCGQEVTWAQIICGRACKVCGHHHSSDEYTLKETA